MRNTTFLSIILLFLTACGNNKADQPVADNDTAAGVESTYYWEATSNDSTGNLEMKRIQRTDSISTKSIFAFINNAHPRILLELVKTSNDTIYLKIKDATVLTQQMGSTGAMEYLAAAVYNLTELPGIKYVTLDFEEGDHAAPGTYTRESFKDQ